MQLDPKLKVPVSEVHWYYISDYYAGPIAGLAYYQKRVVYFCCLEADIPDQYIYFLYELTEEELAEELRQKSKFEELIGTHWSFDTEGKPLPYVLRSQELQDRYVREERCGPGVKVPDKPMIAWFDTAKD